MSRLIRPLLVAILALGSSPTFAADGELCGKQGVWIQILGAGGPELTDGNAGPSYLVWLDAKARLLVDTAPGSATRFGAVGADFADLDAIVFTNLHADHTADFPGYVKASQFSNRDRPLTVLGPDSGENYPDTETFIERLIGRQGAYPHLAEFLRCEAHIAWPVAVVMIFSLFREKLYSTLKSLSGFQSLYYFSIG